MKFNFASKHGLAYLSFFTLVICMGQRSMQAQTYIPVPVYDLHAAFAYSMSTDLSGGSWRGASRQAVEDVALKYCQNQGAQDCAIVAWFKNKCGSLASSPEGIYGVGFHGARDWAAEAALEECRENGGVACRVRHAMCAQDPG